MDNDTTDRIAKRAYELWEQEGRPDGRHDDHWSTAEREAAGGEAAVPSEPHPGMMGDGTEEQNLGQPGNPAARIGEDEVREAFGGTKAAK
ncbi:DUF2934 domain-containing protein [Lichenihabitans sp. Uapishka_5]|uniref:DUF2934 domain-containing protein n=1 Tax=Lichenihabitans sp. Uapishka_5 TaxID=3037302 RepID=UPI0029E7F6B8|nr:DUF2934 domain-containing protein [Lichenihabitans sp. Uapishka_5]MDX7952774.1 DUF2934 domain-containing protein [Lichenihabitans sp. Uapishka_5]